MTALAIPLTTELWAYAGVRFRPGSDDLLVDWWYNTENLTEFMYFRRRQGGPGYVIGGVYKLKVVRDGADVTRHRVPEYTDRLVAEPLRIEWAAQDDSTRLTRQRQVDEENLTRMDALDTALEPLRALFYSRPKYIEREALLVAILRRVMS